MQRFFNPQEKIKFRGFNFIILCYILSLSTEGFGNYIFGFQIITNISNFFIFTALIFQILSNKLHVPKIVLVLFLLILVHTFIINFSINSYYSSLKHIIGLFLFSVSFFSFVTTYKDRIVDILDNFYKFIFIDSLIAIFQVLAFIIFNKSFLPQNFLSGSIETLHSDTFKTEILDIFPRAIGLSTEPAHFALIVLPGVYISLLVISGKKNELRIGNIFKSVIIIIGFILSFSIVGYFGLSLCLFFIFKEQLINNLRKKIYIILPALLLIIFIFQSPIGYKVKSLVNMLKDVKKFSYTTSDATGWALVSNMMIAQEGLRRSFYLGTGLNTHEYTYDENIRKIFRNDQIILELNKADAGSIFIRIVSEFGILGIALYIFYLFYFRIRTENSNSQLKSINNLCLVFLITYSIRSGQYIYDYFILYLALFYTSFILNKNFSSEHDFSILKLK
jgi:hypothetical protein